jgi:hypothetical protein
MRLFYSTLRLRLRFQHATAFGFRFRHAAPFEFRFQHAPCGSFQYFRSLFWPRSGEIRLCQGQDAFLELLQLGDFVDYGPDHDAMGSGRLVGG